MTTIHIKPGERFESEVVTFQTAFSGVAVQIVDILEDVIVPRTTDVQEYPAGSGRYRKSFEGIIQPGQYSIIWDEGSNVPQKIAVDQLIVSRVARINEPFESEVFGFPAGLAGTAAIRVTNLDEIDVIARTTAGIFESPVGSGRYKKTFTAGLPTIGRYTAIWDTGVISPSTVATDEIVIIGNTEILASLDDIQANIDSDLIVATYDNTALLQISVARIVRAYLGRVYSNLILQEWSEPEVTPEIIREIAAKFIASGLYFNKISAQTSTVEERSMAQIKYDEAMALLKQIFDGDIIIPGIDQTTPESLGNLDFFPVDATDRAFTMSMEL